MKYLIPFLFFVSLIISCDGGNSYSYDSPNQYYDSYDEEIVPLTRQESVESSQSQLEINEGNQPSPIEKKIIKDGSIEIKVDELETAKQSVDALLKKYDAYYSNEILNNNDWNFSYNLSIRVPSKNFENLITELEGGYGTVTFKTINSRDVTEQFVDLEIRLENKKNYLARYRELLKKANSIKEILEIEEKIRNLEEEIESVTGRLKYLSNQVDFSTLELTISQPVKYKYTPEKRDSFWEKLKNSLSKGWFAFVDFSLFILLLWPFWIGGGIVAYFIIRRKRNKKQSF